MRVSLERILDRMRDIRLSVEHHGTPGDHHFHYEPTWVLRGLTDLHLPSMIDTFEDSGKVASLIAVRPSQSFHLVDLDLEGEVASIQPVGESDMLINGGFFVLRQEVFDSIERAIDPTTGTLSGQFSFPNPERILRPSQYGKARMVIYVKHDAVIVLKPSGLRRFHFFDHFPQFFEGDILNLAHAFARDAEFLAHFFEGFLWATIQAKPGA